MEVKGSKEGKPPAPRADQCRKADSLSKRPDARSIPCTPLQGRGTGIPPGMLSVQACKGLRTSLGETLIG